MGISVSVQEDLSFGSHDSMQPLQGVMHRGGTPSQVGGKPTHPSCQLHPAQAMEKACGNGGASTFPVVAGKIHF